MKHFDFFSRHAFERETPPREYESLSSRVVVACGGLPLSLEVLGSLLHSKDKIIWEDTAKKLERVPDRAVQEKLKISYNTLEHEQRQMFSRYRLFLHQYGKVISDLHVGCL